MGEDNVFTLFLKGIFVLILLFMLLALVLPFVSNLYQEFIPSLMTLFTYTFFILMAIIIMLVISRVFK